jgi:hypothetical protein
MSSIRAKFEVSSSNRSRATAPETDASDNIISPLGWAKKGYSSEWILIYRILKSNFRVVDMYLTLSN